MSSAGKVCFIDDAQAGHLGVIVEPEDVLLNIAGASVAVCVAPAASCPPVNQHVAIIRPDRDLLHHEFLAALLLSPTMKASCCGSVALGQPERRSPNLKLRI